MGHAIKSITRSVTKAFKQVLNPITSIVKPNVPTNASDAAGQFAATQVVAPEKDNGDETDESLTESGKKKIAATGKKSLTVSRSTGGGVNI